MAELAESLKETIAAIEIDHRLESTEFPSAHPLSVILAAASCVGERTASRLPALGDRIAVRSVA
ncbi:hypothetical protein QSJ19_24555 [Gordonia sp. ABSL11-1]|uniref:hypothetical protein n=1 Tax=Gordonia sp. ABSL11-1 TaxID=3053924 RepID=UPI0025737369|nr:hypothetical protein [Gordonia sp. ABSL11-1]MDL9948698.1 hypothetical protein [Gordonia sp. ABSL11-1]